MPKRSCAPASVHVDHVWGILQKPPAPPPASSANVHPKSPSAALPASSPLGRRTPLRAEPGGSDHVWGIIESNLAASMAPAVVRQRGRKHVEQPKSDTPFGTSLNMDNGPHYPKRSSVYHPEPELRNGAGVSAPVAKELPIQPGKKQFGVAQRNRNGAHDSSGVLNHDLAYMPAAEAQALHPPARRGKKMGPRRADAMPRAEIDHLRGDPSPSLGPAKHERHVPRMSTRNAHVPLWGANAVQPENKRILQRKPTQDHLWKSLVFTDAQPQRQTERGVANHPRAPREANHQPAPAGKSSHSRHYHKYNHDGDRSHYSEPPPNLVAQNVDRPRFSNKSTHDFYAEPGQGYREVSHPPLPFYKNGSTHNFRAGAIPPQPPRYFNKNVSQFKLN